MIFFLTSVFILLLIVLVYCCTKEIILVMCHDLSNIFRLHYINFWKKKPLHLLSSLYLEKKNIV